MGGDALDSLTLVLLEISEGVLRIPNKEHEGPVVAIGEAAHSGGTVGDCDCVLFQASRSVRSFFVVCGHRLGPLGFAAGSSEGATSNRRAEV